MGSLGVVLDTNVVVSALGWGGKPEECLKLGLRGEVELIGSPDTLAEVARVFEYPKFGLTDQEKAALLSAFLERTTVVRPDRNIDEIESDPVDNAFLECAVSGGAAGIVSGDEDLLEVGEYQGVEILTPDEFLKRFE